MPVERSAGAVVFYRDKKGTIQYLLLHYRAGHWDFPKGNIEKGERPEETTRREIKEETSIKEIEFIPGFKQTIKYFHKREGKTFFKTVVFFLAQSRSQKVKISWEHQGFQWLPYREASEQLAFKNAKSVLKKANEFLSGKGL